jgi:hypothetical protein
VRKFLVSLLVLLNLFIQPSCTKRDVNNTGPTDQPNTSTPSTTSSIETQRNKAPESPSPRTSRSPQIDTGKTGGLQKKGLPAHP